MLVASYALGFRRDGRSRGSSLANVPPQELLGVRLKAFRLQALRIVVLGPLDDCRAVPEVQNSPGCIDEP
jgi:hypothetical protein